MGNCLFTHYPCQDRGSVFLPPYFIAARWMLVQLLLFSDAFVPHFPSHQPCRSDGETLTEPD